GVRHVGEALGQYGHHHRAVTVRAEVEHTRVVPQTVELAGLVRDTHVRGQVPRQPVTHLLPAEDVERDGRTGRVEQLAADQCGEQRGDVARGDDVVLTARPRGQVHQLATKP